MLVHSTESRKEFKFFLLFFFFCFSFALLVNMNRYAFVISHQNKWTWQTRWKIIKKMMKKKQKCYSFLYCIISLSVEVFVDGSLQSESLNLHQNDVKPRVSILYANVVCVFIFIVGKTSFFFLVVSENPNLKWKGRKI